MVPSIASVIVIKVGKSQIIWLDCYFVSFS